ncbi:glycoside hydrolase family 5 protein [Demequina sp. NBRC 110052]|uniref:glycoside hydrolase family 5 protein n=1 Tax=Demequina sp. NBRC 110052 TaxID=1570341 RepID=UPI0009FD5EF4|nr:cellulase family glycosylhydrolase [Demequina sp. NBRC 110052]
MTAAAHTGAPVQAPPQGFLRAEGTHLVDDAGLRLPRGVGLGNWLLPEGYMWLFGDDAASPRAIEALFARLAGDDYASHFWDEYRRRYITEADISRIAALGFDHVRVPINARVIQGADGDPLSAGYALLDDVVRWSERHGIRVLLDLHGAPGGQTGTNIDDSARGRPDLFLDPHNLELTERLWSDLATHFAGNHTVMGYDLLNEPLPEGWRSLTPDLVALYRRLTSAIRAVDDDHLIMYEGTHWATDFSAFDERWDDNQALQFHRYWSRPDREGIAAHLALRDDLQVPLYMGEGGENTPEWIYTSMRLYEAEGIGWNLWPWKKLATRTSPVSIAPPEGWELIRTAAQGGPHPPRDEAQAILDGLLDAVALESAHEVPEVIDAALGASPSTVPAWGFGFHGEGSSYGAAGTSRITTFREGDAVAVVHAQRGAQVPNPFQQTDGRHYRPDEVLVVELPPGGWLEYEFTDPEARAAEWTAVDEEQRPVSVDVTPSARGIRVEATGSGARFAALVRHGGAVQTRMEA